MEQIHTFRMICASHVLRWVKRLLKKRKPTPCVSFGGNDFISDIFLTCCISSMRKIVTYADETIRACGLVKTWYNSTKRFVTTQFTK